jgi:redox-sensitive bicupin YhaK (pirin superfamily)
MDNRTVEHVLKGFALTMGNLPMVQPLPTGKVERISPFLLLHHFGPVEAKAGFDPMDLGPHPHRGFSPVTFLYSGGLRHKDSRGNEGILGAGDVQWMTAGRGIIHSERASKEFLEQGGTLEGIQLWVNLPRASKWMQPTYQDINEKQQPLITFAGESVRMRLVAGSYKGKTGPARSVTPALILKIAMKKESDHFINIPSEFNAALYLLDGEVRLPSGFSYAGKNLIHFRRDGAGISLHAEADTRMLLLAGEPIDEPVAQQGPFVMNTQTEVLEAMRDYRQGKMGFYID